MKTIVTYRTPKLGNRTKIYEARRLAEYFIGVCKQRNTFVSVEEREDTPREVAAQTAKIAEIERREAVRDRTEVARKTIGE